MVIPYGWLLGIAIALIVIGAILYFAFDIPVGTYTLGSILLILGVIVLVIWIILVVVAAVRSA